MTDPQTVLILGASRGLGLALAETWCERGWRVIATQRKASPGLQDLAGRFPDLQVKTADIADAASIRALRAQLDGRRLDVLFVNAGIALNHTATPLTAHEGDFNAMMQTNALGPVRAVELLEDLVAANGVIAAMSSELGSIANNPGGWDLYSASKAALNMLMKCFAARRPQDPRAMLVMCPGWVRTDMGGPDAALSVEQSIPLVADTVEQHRGRAGFRYVNRHGETVPW